MIETTGFENPGANLDYQIVSQLSADESGLLYRAIMGGSGSKVDLWVLSGIDDLEQQRIKKRIVVASQMHHPAAAWVIDSSKDGDHPCYLLEPLSEQSLSDVRGEISENDKTRVLEFGKQLTSVVAAAHRLGLVHGKISPETAFVRSDGSLQLDFVRPRSAGETWARRVDPPHSAVRRPFCAPEIASDSDFDAAGDVFSVAATLIWLFTGRPGDPGCELSTFRDQLAKWFGDWRVQADELDAFCQLLIESLQLHPWDRASRREISSQLERMVDTCIDNADTTVYLGQTSDAIARTSDFVVASGADRSPDASIGAGFQIGRYRVRRKLGEGGMGAVYEAEDPSDGGLVAVKTLRHRLLHEKEAVRRFRKEARLLGEIKSPYVTNLLEVNEDNGLHYIVMEYVAGVDLHRLIRQGAPFDERVALSIIADTARGLVSSHEQDIIHRDVKPANVLLAIEMRSQDDARQVTLSLDTLKHFQVKLSDFGLARQLEQTESMDMTRAGGMLGTPNYMAPEQFTDSSKISPATDVYALGVTLFEMLAGKPPFESPELTKLIHLHCKEHPPSLQKLNPNVSDATCQLVQRAMAKDPHQRFADAGQFLREVECLLRGEATNISLHPETPPHVAGEVFEEVFEWELQSEAADLWPAVSNTERINCAVGVPSVIYDTRRDEHGRLRKFGSFRMAGLQIGWEEHPFEWVEGQRLGILREFHQGPFVWFLSIVELVPQPGGGTRLRHTVRIRPRGLVGRLVAALEVSVKGKRNLDRVYHRIDKSLAGGLGTAPTLDPYCEPRELSRTRRQRLERRLDRLSIRGIDHDVIECLGSFLREAPSQELARIRPLALARNFEIDGNRLLSGCLAAAKEGLLDLHWDILCPTCRISSQTTDTLQAVENHARCEVCDLDFEVDLSESIEMIFRVSPEIREAELGTFCIGGPEHSPHVVLQVRLAAGKRVELAPLLSEGEYLLRSAQLTYNFRLRVLPTRGTTHTELVLSPAFDPKRESQVRAGRNVITITNDYDHELVVRLERVTPRRDVVTAAQASALPQFRELFPDETPQVGRLMKVATAAFLAIDLSDSEDLFLERADGDAFVIVSTFQRLAEKIAQQHSGAVVKAIDTESLIAFETPSDALRTALELTNVLQSEESPLRFCAALHHGATLATATDGHLDYFGGTVHLVQRLVRLAGPGELLMSEQVAAEPIVASEIREHELPSEVCHFPQFGQAGLRCQRVRIT